MNEEQKNIDLDIEKFHGLSNDDGEYQPRNHRGPESVKLGFWTYLASFIVILWLTALSFIFLSGMWADKGSTSQFVVSLASFYSLLAIAHILVLFRVEPARKFVVVHAYFLLLGIPVGTVVGAILISSLKGKSFETA